MRQWERPLKKADWAAIDKKCTDFLIRRSKDVQIAVWLAEAWMRCDGLPGLHRGLFLIQELLSHYWEEVHPRIEAGDPETRIAPLEWLSESFSRTLRSHIVLVHVPDYTPSKINLMEWERLPEKSPNNGALSDFEDEGYTSNRDDVKFLSRELLIQWVAQNGLATEIKSQYLIVEGGLSLLEQISSHMRGKIGDLSANLLRIRETLLSIQRVHMALLTTDRAASADVSHEETAIRGPVIESGSNRTGLSEMTSVIGAGSAPNSIESAEWRNRDEAYAALDRIANFLLRAEPHSPTPYLIRRAVKWGKLTLPQLMAEIMREEGDLNKIMDILGVRQDRD
jgi:type VI secretion system protein ImpA